MAASTVTISIRVAWWAKHYITALRLMALMFGMEPNWDRVNYWLNKAIKMQVGPDSG